jgi:hypothetical protein
MNDPRRRGTTCDRGQPVSAPGPRTGGWRSLHDGGGPKVRLCRGRIWGEARAKTSRQDNDTPGRGARPPCSRGWAGHSITRPFLRRYPPFLPWNGRPPCGTLPTCRHVAPSSTAPDRQAQRPREADPIVSDPPHAGSMIPPKIARGPHAVLEAQDDTRTFNCASSPHHGPRPWPSAFSSPSLLPPRHRTSLENRPRPPNHPARRRGFAASFRVPPRSTTRPPLGCHRHVHASRWRRAAIGLPH